MMRIFKNKLHSESLQPNDAISELNGAKRNSEILITCLKGQSRRSSGEEGRQVPSVDTMALKTHISHICIVAK